MILAYLMRCFREVLEELGELANNLPSINEVRIDLTPNPRLCQAYSIAFQFLNMVEENGGRTDLARSGIRAWARR